MLLLELLGSTLPSQSLPSVAGLRACLCCRNECCFIQLHGAQSSQLPGLPSCRCQLLPAPHEPAVLTLSPALIRCTSDTISIVPLLILVAMARAWKNEVWEGSMPARQNHQQQQQHASAHSHIGDRNMLSTWQPGMVLTAEACPEGVSHLASLHPLDSRLTAGSAG